ncbi:MAG TPA: DUF2703 domain-containing protein [Spirochaetia bacterium]|nr:DUF2703 domain-containing protein [Spirochaetia bacterium]
MKTQRRIDVTVYFTEGCPNAEPTVELVRRTLMRTDAEALVHTIQVDDINQAERFHFLGSPSVQINGRDIETARRKDAPFFGCRLYWSNGTMTGSPTAQMILDGIAEYDRTKSAE